MIFFALFQIVKSMELATIVASEGNSFYLWGSRPVVMPPLKLVFSGIYCSNINLAM